MCTRFLSLAGKSVTELDSGDGCAVFVNTLKTIQLYTLKGRILWHVNCTSLKLLFLKKSPFVFSFLQTDFISFVFLLPFFL